MMVSSDARPLPKPVLVDIIHKDGAFQDDVTHAVSAPCQLTGSQLAQCANEVPKGASLDVLTDSQEPTYEVLLGEDKQQNLSQALIAGTLGVLPIDPSRVQDVSPPLLEVQQVDGRTAEVKVTQTFRVQLGESDNPAGAAQPRYQSTCHILDVDGNNSPPNKTATDTAFADAKAGVYGQSTKMPHFLQNDFKWQIPSSPTGVAPQRMPDSWAIVPRGARSGQEEQDVLLGKKLVSLCDGLMLVPPWNRFHSPPPPGSLAVWELDPDKVMLGRRMAVGGFAEVFIGKYEGTVVAVKRLFTQQQPGVETRFVHEVSMLANLRHPNLILFMGYCTHPALCIVSEFMSRGSLHHVMQQQHAPLIPQQQRLVAISVARGMAYLHTRNPPILHLDLKSPNILVDSKWRVKVADFGLSKVRRGHMHFSGMSGGTAEWQAPEVIRGESFGEAADVYSYGVVLWEILTGQAPWENLMPAQIVAAVAFQHQSLPRPPSGDPFLCDLCQACLNPDPALRPTFPDIVLRLEEHYGQPPLSDSVPLSSISSSEGSTLLPSACPLRALPPPANHNNALPQAPTDAHQHMHNKPPAAFIQTAQRTKEAQMLHMNPGTAADASSQVVPGTGSVSGSNVLGASLTDIICAGTETNETTDNALPTNTSGHVGLRRDAPRNFKVQRDVATLDGLQAGGAASVEFQGHGGGPVGCQGGGGGPVGCQGGGGGPVGCQGGGAGPERMETDSSVWRSGYPGEPSAEDMSVHYSHPSVPDGPDGLDGPSGPGGPDEGVSRLQDGCAVGEMQQSDCSAMDSATPARRTEGADVDWPRSQRWGGAVPSAADDAAGESPVVEAHDVVIGPVVQPFLPRNLVPLSPFALQAGGGAGSDVQGAASTAASRNVTHMSPFAAAMFQTGSDD